VHKLTQAATGCTSASHGLVCLPNQRLSPERVTVYSTDAYLRSCSYFSARLCNMEALENPQLPLTSSCRGRNARSSVFDTRPLNSSSFTCYYKTICLLPDGLAGREVLSSILGWDISYSKWDFTYIYYISFPSTQQFYNQLRIRTHSKIYRFIYMSVVWFYITTCFDLA
jgi:hypothetical protein